MFTVHFAMHTSAKMGNEHGNFNSSVILMGGDLQVEELKGRKPESERHRQEVRLIILHRMALLLELKVSPDNMCVKAQYRYEQIYTLCSL